MKIQSNSKLQPFMKGKCRKEWEKFSVMKYQLSFLHVCNKRGNKNRKKHTAKHVESIKTMLLKQKWVILEGSKQGDCAMYFYQNSAKGQSSQYFHKRWVMTSLQQIVETSILWERKDQNALKCVFAFSRFCLIIFFRKESLQCAFTLRCIQESVLLSFPSHFTPGVCPSPVR